MPNFICVTCGTQFAETTSEPEDCPICVDARQYVGWSGQRWTTLDALTNDHHTIIKTEEPGLTGIGVHPEFAIGQRALLVQSPHGNVLWECISLLDEPTVAVVQSLGGIAAIAISHPHYYSAMVEWSRAFDAPIYLHEDTRQWVMRPHPSIVFWHGETRSLGGGLTLIRCGSHFSGDQVLHWVGGAEGSGALLSGDILTVAMDRRHVSFMYSYPNLIPVSPEKVRYVLAAIQPFRYDRIYGAWWNRVIATDGEAAVARSAERYIAAITDG